MEQENPAGNIEQPVAPKPVEKTPKSKTCLLTSILLSVLAIGGIAFGVYGMILANQPHKCPAVSNITEENIIEVTCPDGTTTKVEKIVDNDLAQNLIRPYLGTFNYLNNLLDYTFDDDAKIIVAFNNLPSYNLLQVGDHLMVYYNDINGKYQELFGSSSSLEKKDYNSAKAPRFTYDDSGWGGSFNIMPFEGGGYGAAMFNIIKSASYNSDNIIVEVYHDRISTCEVDNNDGYCVDIESVGPIADSIDDFNMRDLITNFSDRIPVYTMTFAKDNGHYVLTNVEKQ